MWFVWSKTSYKGDKVDKGVPRGPRGPKKGAMKFPKVRGEGDSKAVWTFFNKKNPNLSRRSPLR